MQHRRGLTVGADQRVCPCIVPQFLTLLPLSFIYFQVFLSQLFDRKKLQKLPAHGVSKSLPFFAQVIALTTPPCRTP